MSLGSELRNGFFLSLVSPSSDHAASGITESVTVGENVAFGDLLYCKSDGKWWKADADQSTTMPGSRLALAAALANATCNALALGLVRDDSWSWTVGGIVYASTTSGSLTQSQPSGTSDQVQPIGVAYHANKIIFQPSLVLVEVV